ncbi:MAG: hypothetical protein RM368_12460 [Nostoc sp. DedSLP03]|uniref:hypothetical protein n=1 Tax=Nostoc sp. DedSLP03 TaxID=3075400 RepID=UPI002AD33873|nr:hypothetical protein [Nostoc sp. DedSLP03]MDZ7965769.1 hypothetical protein [Nostoc sp. DedSLP03]
MSDTKNNQIAVAGTDLFADSENFLNELLDSELVQINGGAFSNLSAVECGGGGRN